MLFARCLAYLLSGYQDCIFFLDSATPCFIHERFLAEYCHEEDYKFMAKVPPPPPPTGPPPACCWPWGSRGVTGWLAMGGVPGQVVETQAFMSFLQYYESPYCEYFRSLL